MKGMILAAGLGSRLKPWTDQHPKALAIVNGQSLLQRNIIYLQKAGIFDVIVNVHHFADQIIDAIERNKGWGSAITISDEKDVVLETGGGLQKAAWYLFQESDFVLMNVDILTDLNLSAMIQQHLLKKPLATLAVSNRETSRYFIFNEQHLLSGWCNTKTGEEKRVRTNHLPQLKAFSGIHVIQSSIFPLIKQNGKFSMVDVYLDLAGEYPIESFDHSGAHFVDVGKSESIEKAEALFV
jgi:NDP-sugar pyrophosphorylase family protein